MSTMDLIWFTVCFFAFGNFQMISGNSIKEKTSSECFTQTHPTYHRLRCEDGAQISVLRVHMGSKFHTGENCTGLVEKEDEGCCTPDPGDCLIDSGTNLRHVQTKCGGQQTCQVEMMLVDTVNTCAGYGDNNQTFSLIAYICTPVGGLEVKTSSACYGSNELAFHSIACPVDFTVGILAVYFGSKLNSSCPMESWHETPQKCCQSNEGDCLMEAGQRGSKIWGLCHGWPACRVQAERTAIGNHCPLQTNHKWTSFQVVRYICILDTLIKRSEWKKLFTTRGDETTVSLAHPSTDLPTGGVIRTDIGLPSLIWGTLSQNPNDGTFIDGDSPYDDKPPYESEPPYNTQLPTTLRKPGLVSAGFMNKITTATPYVKESTAYKYTTEAYNTKRNKPLTVNGETTGGFSNAVIPVRTSSTASPTTTTKYPTNLDYTRANILPSTNFSRATNNTTFGTTRRLPTPHNSTGAVQYNSTEKANRSPTMVTKNEPVSNGRVDQRQSGQSVSERPLHVSTAEGNHGIPAKELSFAIPRSIAEGISHTQDVTKPVSAGSNGISRNGTANIYVLSSVIPLPVEAGPQPASQSSLEQSSRMEIYPSVTVPLQIRATDAIFLPESEKGSSPIETVLFPGNPSSAIASEPQGFFDGGHQWTLLKPSFTGWFLADSSMTYGSQVSLHYESLNEKSASFSSFTTTTYRDQLPGRGSVTDPVLQEMGVSSQIRDEMYYRSSHTDLYGIVSSPLNIPAVYTKDTQTHPHKTPSLPASTLNTLALASVNTVETIDGLGQNDPSKVLHIPEQTKTTILSGLTSAITPVSKSHVVLPSAVANVDSLSDISRSGSVDIYSGLMQVQPKYTDLLVTSFPQQLTDISSKENYLCTGAQCGPSFTPTPVLPSQPHFYSSVSALPIPSGPHLVREYIVLQSTVVFKHSRFSALNTHSQFSISSASELENSHKPLDSNLNTSPSSPIHSFNTSFNSSPSSLDSSRNSSFFNSNISLTFPVSNIYTAPNSSDYNLKTSPKPSVSSFNTSFNSSFSSINSSSNSPLSNLNISPTSPVSSLNTAPNSSNSPLKTPPKSAVSSLNTSPSSSVPLPNTSPSSPLSSLNTSPNSSVFSLNMLPNSSVSLPNISPNSQLSSLNTLPNSSVSLLNTSPNPSVSSLNISANSSVFLLDTSPNSQVSSLKSSSNSPISDFKSPPLSFPSKSNTSLTYSASPITSHYSPESSLNTSFNSPLSRLNTSFNSPLSRLNTSFNSPLSRVNTSFNSPLSRVNTSFNSPLPGLNPSPISSLFNLNTTSTSPVSQLMSSPNYSISSLSSSSNSSVTSFSTSPISRVSSLNTFANSSVPDLHTSSNSILSQRNTSLTSSPSISLLSILNNSSNFSVSNSNTSFNSSLSRLNTSPITSLFDQNTSSISPVSNLDTANNSSVLNLNMSPNTPVSLFNTSSNSSISILNNSSKFSVSNFNSSSTSLLSNSDSNFTISVIKMSHSLPVSSLQTSQNSSFSSLNTSTTPLVSNFNTLPISAVPSLRTSTSSPTSNVNTTSRIFPSVTTESTGTFTSPSFVSATELMDHSDFTTRGIQTLTSGDTGSSNLPQIGSSSGKKADSSSSKVTTATGLEKSVSTIAPELGTGVGTKVGLGIGISIAIIIIAFLVFIGVVFIYNYCHPYSAGNDFALLDTLTTQGLFNNRRNPNNRQMSA